MYARRSCACLRAALLTGTALCAPAPALLDHSTQEKVQSLLKERSDVLREVIKAREAQFKAGRLTPDVLLEAHRALLGTELELTTARAGRVRLCEEMAKRSRDYESKMKAAFDAGRITPGDLTAAAAEARADEVRLLRERAGPRPTEKQAAELRKVRREYRELLAKAFEDQQKAFVGTGNVWRHVVSRTARRKLENDLEWAEKPGERLVAHGAYLAAAQQRASVSKEGFEAGRVNYYMYHSCIAECLGAEIGLLRAGGKPGAEEARRAQELQRKCRAEWAEVLKVAKLQWKIGVPLGSDVPTISAALLDAELGLAEKPDDRIAAHRAHLKRLRQFEEFAKAQYDVGRLTAPDYLKAKAARLGAEVAFVRTGGKPADLGK